MINTIFSADTQLLVLFTGILHVEDYPPAIILRPYHHAKSMPHTRLLLKLASVCRRWRKILLNSPVFWGVIDPCTNEQVQTFLERSSAAPLFLRLDETLALKSNIHLLSLLPSYAPRIRRLDLQMQRQSFGKEPKTEFLPLDLPNLRCLIIRSEVGKARGENIRPSRATILNGETSSLKALSLLGHIPFLPENDFPNLTHMALEFSSKITPLLGDIVSVLAHTPRLESLLLGQIDRTYTARQASHSSESPLTQVLTPLQYLKTLTLVDCDAEASVDLLSSLTLPDTLFAHFPHLKFLSPDIGGEEIKEIAERCFRASSTATSLDVLGYEEGMNLVMHGSTAGFFLDMEPYIPPTSIGTDWELLLSELPGALSMHNVTKMRFAAPVEPVVLPKLLAHLPLLVDLHVGYTWCYTPRTVKDQMGALCDALAPQDPETADDSASAQIEPVCPRLERLSFALEIKAPRHLKACAALLERVAAVRAAKGTPLRRFSVQPESGFIISRASGLRCRGSRLAEGASTAFDALRAHVAGECVVIPPGEKFVEFKLDEEWMRTKDDVERYWYIGLRVQLAYRLPYIVASDDDEDGDEDASDDDEDVSDDDEDVSDDDEDVSDDDEDASDADEDASDAESAEDSGEEAEEASSEEE